MFYKAYRIVHCTWNLKCLFFLCCFYFFLCVYWATLSKQPLNFFTSCLDDVKYDRDKKSLLKSTRIFPLISRQCTSCLQFFNYSPNTQEIRFTCSWIDIFTCYLGSNYYYYTMGVILGLIDVSLFAKLTSSLEFAISFTVVLAGKVKEILA